MIANVLALTAVAFAFRGSYLGKTATTNDDKVYATTVSLCSALLCMVAFLLRD